MKTPTIKKIDKILGIINTHPEFSQCFLRERKQAILVDSRVHSVNIEGIDKEEAYVNIKNAEEYFCKYGLNDGTIRSLGKIVEPKKCVYGYRSSRIDPDLSGQIVDSEFPSDFRVYPPKAVEVPSLIGNLIFYLDNTEDNDVLRASQAHLEFSRIHPYPEGNGRVARLLQNFCLSERGYPAAIIEKDDRGLYRVLIQNALEERMLGHSNFFCRGKHEAVFSEFIASKVLSSVKNLEKDLSENRAYKVHISDFSDFGFTHSIAKRIRGISRSSKSKGVRVNLNKKSNGEKGVDLMVIGDLSRNDITKLLEDIHKKNRFHYRVQILGC